MTDKLYAVLSDIHGNEEAFRNALAYLKGLAVEEIYCLGDLVGYGQGAAACVELARKNNITCVQGNHDAQVRPPRDPRMRLEAQAALDVAMEQLSDEQIEWLINLPTSRVIENIMVLVHGALSDRDDYILTHDDVKRNFGLLAEKHPGIDLCFFGHSHLGMVIGDGKIMTRFPHSDIVDLKPRVPYLVNPGSVGQPRDGIPLSSFVILDPSQHQLTLVRLEYDIAAEQERMRQAGLPEKLWKRLELGK